MQKRIVLILAVVTALLLTGCGLRTVEEMYALPKRSHEYSQLQATIDRAMADMTYSAPVSGDNQQSVQSVDLDGDGVKEYLVFASDNSDKPLKVLIFAETGDGTCRHVETISSNGAAFEQVEYVELDGRPGCELIIGRQVSDQVLRSVSVYTYESGTAQQQMLVGYSKFLTCDLDDNGLSELMVIRPGEAQTQRGIAVLYSFQGSHVERSAEADISKDPSNIRRITHARLQDGTAAVFVASSADQLAIVTDVFAIQKGKFANITFSAEAETSVDTLRNYYVYADDIDDDGVMELPGLLSMRTVGNRQDFLLRWFSLDVNGLEMDKMYTFHNLTGGWYLKIDSALATQITVEEMKDTYFFSVWDPDTDEAVPVYTVYMLAGADRDEECVRDGRFALYRTESVSFAAQLESAAENYGITENSLKNSFRVIRQDWRTGETH